MIIVVIGLRGFFNGKKKNKKMKHKFEIDERDIKDVKKNLRKDVVWLIWSSILAI